MKKLINLFICTFLIAVSSFGQGQIIDPSFTVGQLSEYEDMRTCLQMCEVPLLGFDANIMAEFSFHDDSIAENTLQNQQLVMTFMAPDAFNVTIKEKSEYQGFDTYKVHEKNHNDYAFSMSLYMNDPESPMGYLYLKQVYRGDVYGKCGVSQLWPVFVEQISARQYTIVPKDMDLGFTIRVFVNPPIFDKEGNIMSTRDYVVNIEDHKYSEVIRNYVYRLEDPIIAVWPTNHLSAFKLQELWADRYSNSTVTTSE